VAEYYEQKGRLVSVNGDLPVEQVTGQMFWVIEHHSSLGAKQHSDGR
jgi:hypothetical protein